jgi:hypothetical protein
MKQNTAEEIIRWEDGDETEFFEELGPEEIYERSRWSLHMAQLFKDKRDGTIWQITWSRGATEMQDEGPEDIERRQMKAVTKIITAYEPMEA